MAAASHRANERFGMTRRACVAAIATATFSMLVAGSPSAASTESFVTRSGSQLSLDGKPFRFTGINVYNAVNSNLCWYPLASGPLLDDSLTAMGPGVQVVRGWFFQNFATINGARDWTAFDHVLDLARAHGVRVMPTLTNQWADCDGPGGGAGIYKNEAWYAGGYKSATTPGSLVPYWDWVAEIVTRYRDEPTILAWQLINEAEVKPSKDAGCSANGGQTLRAFADDVSGLIKSLDPNHLVSLGTIGGGQCGTQSGEYKSVHDVPGIDLCEYHDFGSPSVAIPGDQWNGLQVRIDQCNELDKPMFIGEVGINPADVGGFAGRAAALAAKLKARRLAGVDGELVWAWNAFGSSPVTFDVGPGDPVLDTLAAGAVAQFVGGSGVGSVDPGFAAATTGHAVEHIDFDGDGLADGQLVTTQYASQGVVFEGLEARETTAFTHSPPFGLQQKDYNTPAFTGNFSYVFQQPVASVGFFFNDDEGDTDVTVTTTEGGVREFRLPRPTGAGGTVSTFYGYVAPGNAITRIDFDPQESGLQITDDLLIGTLPPVTDTNAPTIQLNTPWPNMVVGVGEDIRADFVCADAGGSRLDSCTGTVDPGQPVDTAAAGTKTFTVTASDAAGNPSSFVRNYDVLLVDLDGDGVQDAIDSGPGQFRDKIEGHPDTTGTIVSVDPGLTVSVVESLDPKGVEITVGPGTGMATFSVCGGFVLEASAGSVVVVTCGSVKVTVVTGEAVLALSEDTVLTVPAGVTTSVEAGGDGRFVISEVTGGSVILTIEGASFTIAAGESKSIAAWEFVGFASPVDNDGVFNVVKAGNAVPLRWRLLQADGVAPVTSLTRATIAAESLACPGSSGQSDQLEQVAPGGSGLQNLGNGYYQLNWKTSKGFAGSCKRLRLDLGEGITRDALFKFTR
jgi:mannan endo-1,4-beta-mannosidase